MSLAKQHHEAMVAKGFWENHNLLEKKMLIISELGEAIEAHRKGRMCAMSKQERYEIESDSTFYPEEFEKDFLEFVKDTYEDELADVVLRIWDYMEYAGISQTPPIDVSLYENTGENLYYVVEKVVTGNFYTALDILYSLSPNMDWHIRMKMAFNKTRPRKHGKSY
jgi:NTP pyrophosphatase (non-canonical NTP hydrolase)